MWLVHWLRLDWISFPDTLNSAELNFAPRVREAICLNCNKTQNSQEPVFTIQKHNN